MKVLIDGDSIAYKAASCAKDDDAMMRNIIDTEMCLILAECETTDYELWIEDPIDKNIFRNDIATTKPYKGNRSGLERPELLLEAKQYMASWWNSNVTSDLEAEDAVVRRAYEEGPTRVIVAAIDKDLLMHPFRFYNYRTGKHFSVSREEAETNLWQQVCTGDSTDNIPGIPGIGPAKAKGITNLESAVILYKLKNCSYEYFVEQYNLIYIRKEDHTKIIYPLSEDKWDKI